MKISAFNPIIMTKDAAPIVQLFEELGFEIRHTKQDDGEQDYLSITMSDADGNHVDIAQSSLVQQDATGIRMNVDNLFEAMDLLSAHGFKNMLGDKVTDNGTSKVALMGAPSGYILDVSQHIKD